MLRRQPDGLQHLPERIRRLEDGGEAGGAGAVAPSGARTGGDENRGDFRTAPAQAFAKLGGSHSGSLFVENQAIPACRVSLVEKPARRLVFAHREALAFEQEA